MIKSPYIPLTAIDCTIPALLIDRNAPLDVLHANATARVLAVTQLMETFSSREVQEADALTSSIWQPPQPCCCVTGVICSMCWGGDCSRVESLQTAFF